MPSRIPMIRTSERTCMLSGCSHPTAPFRPGRKRANGEPVTLTKKQQSEVDRRRALPRYCEVHRRRDHRLRSNYGITLADYAEMYAAQDGRCAICGMACKGADAPGDTMRKSTDPVHEMPLQVDHDHETGKVRALLCWPCNNILGLASDDPGTLRAAADYLEVHSN